MKKTYVMIAVLILLCVSAVNAQTANDIKSKVAGNWEVSVLNAPEGYQKFTINFKLNEGKVLMDVFDFKNKELTEKEGQLTTNLYMDGDVKILVWEENGGIKGSAETPVGILSLNFKKIQ